MLLDWGDCPADPPTIDGVSPSFGSTDGGTTITITGTALTNTSAVTVRGNAATNVVVLNDTTVTAVAPQGSPGTAYVRVTTPGGTATISGGFTYISAPPWCTVIQQNPDVAVVTSATLRSAIIATGLPWRVRESGTGIEMVLIPPGVYQRGCSPSQQNGCREAEVPSHQVTLTQAFYLSRTEVTQAQWVATMGSNPSYFTGNPNRPVEQVNWNDIEPFCANTGLRLPTEAEWEYAYRAGTTTAFHGWTTNPSGTSDEGQIDSIAWFDSNSGGQTQPVGGKNANGFGLFDMAGNVFEWCSDWTGSYSSDAQSNPTGPEVGGYRVLRGGFYGTSAYFCRASNRSNDTPVSRNKVYGFRVARNP